MSTVVIFNIGPGIGSQTIPVSSMNSYLIPYKSCIIAHNLSCVGKCSTLYINGKSYISLKEEALQGTNLM